MMMVLAMSVMSCSKSDDDPEPEPKTDAALLGIWVNPDVKETETISQAAYFKRDDVLFFYENNWYHGDYTVTDANHFTAKVCKVRIDDFTWFDNYSAFAVDPNYYDWVFRYEITGNKLYLERGNRSMTLTKWE